MVRVVLVPLAAAAPALQAHAVAVEPGPPDNQYRSLKNPAYGADRTTRGIVHFAYLAMESLVMTTVRDAPRTSR
jgi:hypothetical protein